MADDHGAGPVEIDETVPHSARIWNYWIGGKDNYDVDRQAGTPTRPGIPGSSPRLARPAST